jgi:hypothetical protein
MSLAMDRTTLIRLNKEIADLRNKEATEARKVADAQKKMNAAMTSANRATSPSSAKTYLSTADRESKALQTAQAKQGEYSTKAALKAQEAARLSEKIIKEEESDRKRTAAADDKRRRDDDARRKLEADRQKRTDATSAEATRAMQRRVEELEAQIAQQLEDRATQTPAFKPTAPAGQSEAFDVFISHAWEDKETFVDDLATQAKAAGLRVWYDTAEIEWGDSLRQKIDAGLAGSYFGVAVLSPDFFAKPWPNYELDGLLEKATSGAGRLLPIWHKMTKDEVAKRSFSLSGRMALNTSLMSTTDIVQELVKLRDRYRFKSEPEAGSDPSVAEDAD